jgi:predicted phosphodiesterase
MSWAILSGIVGNLAAYEAVMKDLQQHQVDDIYILGDLVGPTAASEELVKRLQKPRRGELTPQICLGWWEEQCLTLHAQSQIAEPTALIEKYGVDMVKALWNSVSRETVAWIRSLDFGFMELDCLLTHGSSVGVEDELRPDTSPLIMFDRLGRLDANYLFCGRSGMQFKYQIASAASTSSVITLGDTTLPTVHEASRKFVVGVGSVGLTSNKASYTLYNPNSGQIQFRDVSYGWRKGFGHRAS